MAAPIAAPAACPPPWLPEFCAGGACSARSDCRPPGGIETGTVGGRPGVTEICDPGSVVVRVTPSLDMVSDPPNRKLAVVAPAALTANVAMPPRMPIVADGVLIT